MFINIKTFLNIYIYIYIYIYICVCVCVFYSRDEWTSYNTCPVSWSCRIH